MREDLAQFAARVFGLAAAAPAAPPPAILPAPCPGRVTALLGPSGAGKTRALAALARAHPGARLVRPGPAGRTVAQLFGGTPGAHAFACLAACGLADGRVWALRAGRLSAGEQARLWLALALRDAPGLLLADEFDAHLDFDAARALAWNLRRLATRRRLGLVVTTHRPELLPWLAPDDVLRLDGALQAEAAPAPRKLADELEFTPCGLEPWRRFAGWHYLGCGRPGPLAAGWLARLGGRPAAIALFSFPHLLLGARRAALPPAFWPRAVLAGGAAELNARLRLLSRLVVDPRLRGCGVATALLRHALPRLGVPFVECLAQMGEYSGFLGAAGFRREGTVQPPAAARALRRVLDRHGLAAQDLRDPAARSLHAARVPGLGRALAALARSRVQTGHGGLRRGQGDAHALLDRALARLDCRPGYYLWRRDGGNPDA